MASTTLVRNILTQVCVLLNDRSPQYSAWTERELVDWLNEAQIMVCSVAPMTCTRVYSLKLRPGTLQSIETIQVAHCKPLDGSATPTEPVQGIQFLRPTRNTGSDGLTPGRVVRLSDRSTMDALDGAWHTRTGDEVRSVLYDPVMPRHFYVSPGVTGDVWMEVVFTAKPARIPDGGEPSLEIYGSDSSSTQTITVDDEFAPLLVDMVVARANMADIKQADAGKAAAFAQRAAQALNAKVQALTGLNPNLSGLPGVGATAGAAGG